MRNYTFEGKAEEGYQESMMSKKSEEENLSRWKGGESTDQSVTEKWSAMRTKSIYCIS